MRRVRRFVTSEGHSPFETWISKLDKTIQGRIYAAIDRAALGAAKKNIKALGNGVFEIKIDVGPGYRVYFGQRPDSLIVLLGGDKGSQNSDTRKAGHNWSVYVQSQKL